MTDSIQYVGMNIPFQSRRIVKADYGDKPSMILTLQKEIRYMKLSFNPSGQEGPIYV